MDKAQTGNLVTDIRKLATLEIANGSAKLSVIERLKDSVSLVSLLKITQPNILNLNKMVNMIKCLSNFVLEQKNIHREIKDKLLRALKLLRVHI